MRTFSPKQHRRDRLHLLHHAQPLCRTFKKLTGYTVIQYINILKIQKACDLLHETRKSITEIALDCGFNSTMYFCKTFKAILNITPTDYRKI